MDWSPIDKILFTEINNTSRDRREERKRNEEDTVCRNGPVSYTHLDVYKRQVYVINRE